MARLRHADTYDEYRLTGVNPVRRLELGGPTMLAGA